MPAFPRDASSPGGVSAAISTWEDERRARLCRASALNDDAVLPLRCRASALDDDEELRLRFDFLCFLTCTCSPDEERTSCILPTFKSASTDVKSGEEASERERCAITCKLVEASE